MQVVLGTRVKCKFLFSSIFPSIQADDPLAFLKLLNLVPGLVSLCGVRLSVITRWLKW